MDRIPNNKNPLLIMNRLQAVRAFGQRIWLDNLSRDLIASGALTRLFEEDGIAGVTSNPSIFEKAIRTDARYRDDLAALRLRALNAEHTYESLVIRDIRDACDLLAPQYQASNGDDGYVSLEVSPALAHDEAGTVAAARRLWAAVGRPNAMIKVPATPAGIGALATLTREGINVNITLIFSLRQLDNVWDAYLAGLAARYGDGEPVGHVKAVASFFLSRIDNAVDGRVPPPVRGRVAVALAKLAYARYRERFHGEGFAKLRRAGARPQYLLWASTGTKNPDYSDVLYVESLIGPETINTVPDATLAAFRDHGVAAPTLESGLEDARNVIRTAGEAGVDLAEVGEMLQQDGLRQFDDAFAKLMALTG
ncbi:transaldolase [Gulbenkiania indica]|uniref:Transaldolase n=3 Tax=Chromobacteriaceae TaxID=1499392 RepID=A0A0K6GTE5_9NEIS|nr:transaldolase [Gulbenkiania mobilis]CUA81990.1 transaldolase [Gulbenkiania indica]